MIARKIPGAVQLYGLSQTVKSYGKIQMHSLNIAGKSEYKRRRLLIIDNIVLPCVNVVMMMGSLQMEIDVGLSPALIVELLEARCDK